MTFSESNFKIEKSEHIHQSILGQNSMKPGWALGVLSQIKAQNGFTERRAAQLISYYVLFSLSLRSISK